MNDHVHRVGPDCRTVGRIRLFRAVLLPVLFCLVFFLFAGCDWFKSQGEQSSGNTPTGVEITGVPRIRPRVSGGEEWDHYLTVNGTIQRNSEKFHILAFLQRGTGLREMESVLVLGRTRVKGDQEPVAAEFRLKGTINEVHLIRLGPDPSTHLVFTMGTEYEKNRIVVDTSYWDVRRNQKGSWNFFNVWKVLHAYDPREPSSYSPPDFHYWDVDDDGVQEIIVTNPWTGSPPPWRRRWAVFQWNDSMRQPVPLRGLGLFPFREQEPSWLVWSVMEMLGMGHDEEVVRYFSTLPGCDSTPVLLHALNFFPGTLRGPPIWHEREKNRAVLSVNRVNRKMETMRYRFELRRLDAPAVSPWRICRVSLFSVSTESRADR